MARYQLFVDDSGNREYADDRIYGIQGKSLHFVYGSIFVEQQTASVLAERLNRLKREVFNTPRVEVKSNWLRHPKERRVRYLEPFGLSEEKLKDFVDRYYDFLCAADVQLIGAVVNKLHMQQKYEAPYTPWYPPTAAYDALLQRAVQAVPAGSTLAITIDNITGKTPHRNEYKYLLTRHHGDLKAHGSKLQRGISFACLENPPRFVFSEDSELVQAADLVSYNIHRQFRDYGEDWEGDKSALPLYEYFARIGGKFRTDGNGRIQGYGIAKFPMLKRKQWRIRKEE
jgi:hypothetical protein